MSNMSYCRFENTYQDLQDCYENINEPCSDSEKDYRSRLIETCRLVVNEANEDIPDEQSDEDEKFEEEVPDVI